MNKGFCLTGKYLITLKAGDFTSYEISDCRNLRRKEAIMLYGKLSSVISKLQQKCMWIFRVPFLISGRGWNVSLRHHAQNVSEAHPKSCPMDAESDENVKVSTHLHVRQVHKSGFVLHFFQYDFFSVTLEHRDIFIQLLFMFSPVFKYFCV
jgi:hypothetical protein